MPLTFLAEPIPPRGVATEVADGVHRLVADNPGPMTYRGTNTYLVETRDGRVVIDPGPDDAAHVAAIIAHGPIARILLTHGHRDHIGALPALQAATGARVGALPDGFTAIPTPGHAADHVVFARADGVVFSGDHVMSWSTSVVSPPDGDMTDYFASLHRLLARAADRLYLPGHGPPLHEPQAFVRGLLEHRAARENAVLAALGNGAATPAELVPPVYGDIAAPLRPMAERSLLAHLEKLVRESRVRRDGERFSAVG
ncbi:MAG TPA: MBL fold metallo-hydrolase [Acetobacteraceae bacterium]|jgi:glyoxylase-like metal-dependent hydrolase (beta-lactamase superfamily II)|nr:MBL fold metallo-hydrolase [Acetobacteraceae bacterium]